MNRRTTIVVLACAFYALQLALLNYWYTLGGGHNAFDLLFAGVIAAILAAVDAGAARYLLQAMRRVEQLYAADVSEQLESALNSYRVQAEHEVQLAQEIGQTVDEELARTREALAEGRLEDADEHLRRGLDAASKTRRTYCDNVAVAAVLEVKARQCEEAGVGFQVQAVVPEDLPLPETEVAAVFFNLIDNALHECEDLVASDDVEDLPEPEISVRAKVQAGQLFIEVSNPCRPEAKGKARVSSVRRPDASREHGWGSRIVGDIAGAHGGVASSEVKGGTFVARVMIPLPQIGAA